MSREDLEYFLALEYLQPSSPRRFEMCLGFIVQAILIIQHCLTGNKRDIPSWDELIPAPIDTTKEARLAKIREKQQRTIEQGRQYFLAMKRAQDREAARISKNKKAVPDGRTFEDKLREL